MTARAAVPFLAALLIAPLVGCLISASSTSLSKSSRSSSNSSSSSSPGAAERAYREDVSDYTRAYAKSGGGDFRTFQGDLAKLAEKHGITNWEANPATYTAIGEGLGRAEVSDAELMAYKRNLSAGDPDKAKAIQTGYDSAR
jgi:hypothetical protein